MTEHLPSERVSRIWNWLPVFRAVAETEHLPTASELLYVTPSALSRTIRLLEKDSRLLVEIVVRDDGPGIADVERAMQDNSSTGGTLGLGLPGVRRMMDEFEIDSALGRGTCVKIRKWG